ncbi:Collagen alpha-6(VI) chain [Mizuhopecten yessoensis]|uniref:Collagen alpha-6(VI) chain n=1 Tax=Mizuhopecten yessoensis TaxID=6573 RepID=A0A210Q005_MIZYE|nr:Collagen alpha-6(VI) chain [Mizuhopecten yessoensis]
MKLPISLVLVALMAHNAYQQVLNCYVPADIMILIDGSDSIQDQNWREIKNFVSQLVTNFDVGRDAIHVGFVVYSSDVGDHIGLQPFKPKNVLRTLSGILRQPKASTNTAKGIAYVRNEFKTRGRAGVPKILIVITDGSSDNPRETRKQANIAKIEGIRVIAVGIGQTFRDELRQIASRPEKVYTAASFATLQTLVFEIQRMVCTVITTTTTTTTAIPIPTKPPVVIPVPSDKICDVPGDIVFVMDGSDSIDDADFIRQKQFVANLIDNFEISTDAIHVGLIVYSTIIGDTVGLQPPKNKELLKILARNLRHPKVGTNTARGIERARDMIRKEGRAMAPKMIVVITDGRSSSPKLTVAQANMAKVEGITLVSVGVGTQIFSDELNQIASSRRKVFEVSDFRSLELIITSMRDLLCQAITTTTSTTTTTQKPTYIPPPDDLFCNVPADVGILLDGSDSIADADWTKQKYFIASLINNLAVGRDTIHVGVVVFSTIIGETVGLTPFKPKELLMILSNNLKQPKVGTNTALGIQRMRQMLASQGRANAPKVMIIVTDGKSSSPKRTVAQASLAKKEGITVIAVGVGSQLFREELSQIATNDRKLFTVSDFQGLQQIIVTLRNLICQVITTTSTTQLVTTPIPPPVTLQPYPGCEVPAEIMFMMHGSDDIKDDNWGMNKKFVSSLVRNLYVNRGAHHVGMVVYSSSVGDHMSLQPFKEVFDVQNHINSFSHPRGGANTAAALAKIREAFRTHARGGAPKIGVLITDQKSTTPADTKLQAELAKNEGVQFVTLGIGSKVNIGELANIATDSQKLFRAMNFKRLESMMPRIRDMICESNCNYTSDNNNNNNNNNTSSSSFYSSARFYT